MLGFVISFPRRMMDLTSFRRRIIHGSLRIARGLKYVYICLKFTLRGQPLPCRDSNLSASRKYFNLAVQMGILHLPSLSVMFDGGIP